MNVRAVAAQALAEVVSKGKSLSQVLPIASEKLEEKSESALLQEFCYGVLRQYYRLQAYSDLLLKKPFKDKDADIYCLLLIGLYQLLYMRVPAYAAVTETVNASRALKKNWASGLLNAVLRNFQRRQDSLTEKINQIESALYAHPDWLLQQIRSDWPENWQQITESNNCRAPMSLRVNVHCHQRDEYGRQLAASGISFSNAIHSDAGVILKQPVDVEQLPGFFDGSVSVQDTAAQLAATLLNVDKGMRVLDACAAPGGKTAHILELEPKLEKLTAVEIDPGRMARVEENLQRLSLGNLLLDNKDSNVSLLQGDSSIPEAWWDKQPYDRILLDAPCSATGVIRRHPDIKLLRRAEDIKELAKRQAQMLDSLWLLLATGGMLLYATCSILRRENDHQIQDFLKRQPNARERVIQAGWGHACAAGRQIFPGEDDDMDGFYYACLEKF